MDGLHLTLRFLGPTPEASVPTVAEAVRRAAATQDPFEVRIDGGGSFPNPRRPRTLWLAVTHGTAELGSLARAVDRELVAAGWPSDDRPFRAHLTVARSDGVPAGADVARRLTAAAEGVGVSSAADRLVLFESITGGGPARYEPLWNRRRCCTGRHPRARLALPVRSLAEEVPMAPSDPRQTKFVLDESRIPRSWYNIAADLPVPPSPYLHPGTLEPIGPDDLAPLFPMALIGQEVSGRARDRDPRAGPRRLPALPPEPAVPRPPARAGARYPGPHLLQVRGRAARPAATSRTRRSRRPSTTRSRASSRLATETGAGQWGSALAFAGRLLRARGQGLHGPRQLRPEAVPADPHGDVRRGGRGRARRRTTNYGRAGPRRDARQPGFARDGDQRGGRGRRDARRHEVRARLGAQPRAPPPDRHRPGGDRADGDGRRVARRRHRLHRAAARTSRA